MRRTKKWYRKMFFQLLEVSVVNSYLLYVLFQEQYSRTPLTLKKFKQCPVESVVHEEMSTSRGLQEDKQSRPSSSPHDERLNGKPHFMDRKEKGSLPCVICKVNKLRKETIYYCKTCSKRPFLHPDNCFELYHTVKGF
jgi:hypothetical protein